MINWTVRYDMRAPESGRHRSARYAAALEQVSWADEHGCSTVFISEHHGADDGYLPSPLLLSAAVAARTSRARIMPVVVATLHDPFRLAEDIAVLDLISDGRLFMLLVAGYVPDEFAMFGVDFRDRGSLFEEKVAVMGRLLTGEQVTYRGRRGRITPLPVQHPRPPLILGGSSAASARRAATLGDGYLPGDTAPWLRKKYLDQCIRADRPPRFIPLSPVQAVVVADDPEREWARIGPAALHDMNGYRRYSASTPGSSLYGYTPLDDMDELRKTGMYLVLTPQECIEYARSLPGKQGLTLHPLLGGVAPEIGWSSLELFVNEVLPALT